MSAVSPDSQMPLRRLGEQGPEVSALGYGAMGLSGVYGEADDAESARLLRHLLDIGLTFVDTADVYGQGHNERLIGDAIAGRRDEAFLATKFGAGQETGLGRPEYVRKAIDASLERLGADHVDLYYLHRVDPTTPIEETVGALGELVEAGKLRHIGLSEVAPGTLRRAHRTYPVTAVQQEYSLFTREPEEHLLPTMRELGVGLVPYSPLGRGVLTGGFRDAAQVENLQQRQQRYPRFAEQNLQRNLTLVDRLRQRADALGRTPAQLALGWLLAQGEDIVPIPGSRRPVNVEANIEAVRHPLDASVVTELSELFPVGAAAGDRYAPEFSARLEQ
ncbi:aryl-alcohol dehydrogenase-like predicted oxidoreductase [Saccharopolyspora lacisalsi]|uniref:Aryl-alcohol dehydrogenase-like predicted oxidoreductase n=2 Tax=Halosaccharopolyspora lacisalsi TaxID=1000566 RepID=A0A839DTV8_9PSEU|nr:aldo/keto reductase [Halosaccharopolyspora lacisalsi]MBA8824473.1 aryl-alcohol dehydrogenase-like predicted oxidoreductase [Halosaccharopolyspora lacisalsi]